MTEKDALKAEDLRIGNWVSVPMCAAHWQIKSIGESSCSIDDYNHDITEDDNDITYDEIYGISLTEEWLLKFGFEPTYQSSFRSKFDHDKNGFIGYDFSHVEDKSMEGVRYYSHYIKIQYVHQLQNLYYALTGQELTA